MFVYGKLPVLQDCVLDGMASVGLSSTNLSRGDPIGLSGGFSNKAVMGNDAMASLGISRPFEYNDLRVTPYARVTYQYVGQASYNEGSSAAALNIASFSGSAVRGTLGVAAGSLNKDPLKDDYTYRANVAVGADTTGLLNPTLNTTLGGFSSNVTTATAGSTPTILQDPSFIGPLKMRPGYARLAGPSLISKQVSDGSFGAWYGCSTAQTSVYETVYHWYRNFLSDAGFNTEGVVGERKLCEVNCEVALADLRPLLTEHPYLTHPSDYTRPQAIGAKFHREGHPGLLTKSARFPDGDNYVILNPSVLSNPKIHSFLTYRINGQNVIIDKETGKKWLSIPIDAL